MTDTPTAATPAKTKTEYVMLASSGDVNWKFLGRGDAHSSDEAVRKTAAKFPDEVSIVAIPSRSWKPRKVSVETVSRVKLEDA